MSEEDLSDAEQAIDEILKSELERHIKGHSDATEIAVLGLATHRLEHLIGQRRAAIRSKERL